MRFVLIVIVAAAVFSIVGAAAGIEAGKQKICATAHQPVCAVRGEVRKTFANGCLAEIDGFAIADPKPCRGM